MEIYNNEAINFASALKVVLHMVYVGGKHVKIER